MHILREHLQEVWYEDAYGDVVPSEELTDRAVFQVIRYPWVLKTTYYRLAWPTNVATCAHPPQHRESFLDGLGRGFIGRRCLLCRGKQIKKWWGLWPKTWIPTDNTIAYVGEATWPEDLALAIANSNEYSLREAIIIGAQACTRCLNVLAHRYGLEGGYEEYSAAWTNSRTRCPFCKDDIVDRYYPDFAPPTEKLSMSGGSTS